MTALVAAVFIASVMGSLHCVGMCGAFVAFAVGADPERGGSPALHAAYNGGRLATYTLLGAVSGAVGAAVDLGASAAGLQQGAAVVAGAMMVGFGALMLARLMGVRLPKAPLPPGMQRVVASGSAFAAKRPPIVRALVVGLLTTLLPCGWLYAFAITAAGTGEPLKGAVVMAVFWAGTLPALVAVGMGVSRLTGAFRRYVPVATTVAIMLVGVWTIVNRAAIPAFSSDAELTNVSHMEPASVEQVEAIGGTVPPCCRDGH